MQLLDDLGLTLPVDHAEIAGDVHVPLQVRQLEELEQVDQLSQVVLVDGYAGGGVGEGGGAVGRSDNEQGRKGHLWHVRANSGSLNLHSNPTKQSAHTHPHTYSRTHLQRSSGEEKAVAGVVGVEGGEETRAVVLEPMALVDHQAFPLDPPHRCGVADNHLIA